VAARLESARGDGGADPESALRYGNALAHRMIGYLGQLLAAPGGARRHMQP
jgi:hypothetical protein